MITQSDLPILKKLLAYSTEGERLAFLDGLQYQLEQPKVETTTKTEPEPKPEVMPIAALLPKPQSPTSASPKRHSRYRGLQGIVLRLLWTGPATRKDLEPSLPGVAKTAITTCLRRLEVTNVIVNLGPPSHPYGLTAEGRRLAKWYVDHPHAKTMSNSKDKPQ